jgi:hypothetical protein
LELTLQNVLVLLTIQFAVFGWRINREIVAGDQGRRTWFPVPDILNVVSMLVVLAMSVIVPLILQGKSSSNGFCYQLTARAVFSAGFVLLVFHPIEMVAHYGLLNKNGRQGFLKNDRDDYPYFPLQERVVVGIAIISALLVAVFVVQ